MYCIALSCIASYCITHACISISVNGKLQEWHIKTDSTTNRDMFLAGPSILYMTWFMSKTVRKMRLSADLIGCCARYASVMLRWSGVRWGEVGWGGVRWGEVGWGGMRWGEVGWGGVRWGGANNVPVLCVMVKLWCYANRCSMLQCAQWSVATLAHTLDAMLTYGPCYGNVSSISQELPECLWQSWKPTLAYAGYDVSHQHTFHISIFFGCDQKNCLRGDTLSFILNWNTHGP